MMTLTVEIADPKFKPGDVVQVRNSANNQHRIYHIIRFDADGRWTAFYEHGCTPTLRASSTMTGNGDDAAYYTAVYLADSYYDVTELALMRPGNVAVLQRDELDAEGEIIEYHGERTNPDTIENIDSRNAAWIVSQKLAMQA